MWFTCRVIVEFLEGNGEWHALKGAYVVRLEAGVYEVTVVGVAAMWLATPGLFNGMVLRLDGREARAISGAKRENDVVVLRAVVDRATPSE